MAALLAPNGAIGYTRARITAVSPAGKPLWLVLQARGTCPIVSKQRDPTQDSRLFKWLRRSLAGTQGMRSKHGVNLALDILAANAVREIAVPRPDGRLIHLATRDKVIASSVIRLGSFGTDNMSAFVDLLGNQSQTLGDLLFVNVGANIGTTCLNAYDAGFRHLLAIEAEPGNFDLLQRNLANLPDADVRSVHAAAGERSGRMTLYRHARNMGAHSLVAPDEPGAAADAVEVAVEPLSSLIPAGRPFVLLIDVEGFEPQVIRGGAGAIAGECRAMMLEVTPAKYAQADAADLAQHVSTFADTIVLIPEGTRHPASELPRLMRNRPNGHFDVAAIGRRYFTSTTT